MPLTGLTAPTTQSYLKTLFQRVFLPLKSNQSVSVMTFGGAGKWANIRYIIDHLDYFDTLYPQTCYLYLDANLLAKAPEDELENGLTFLSSKAVVQKNSLVEKYFASRHKSDSAKNAFVHIVNTLNQHIVIVVNNAESLLIPDLYAQKAVSILFSLISVNVTRVSFLFITKGESTYATTNLRQIEQYYMQNQVFEREIPFDIECAVSTVNHLSKLQGLTITKQARENIATMGVADALIVKFLCEEYSRNQKFASVCDKDNALPRDIYENSRPTYLDLRFSELTKKLSSASKDFLYSLSDEPTAFLINTGIVDSNGSVVNPLYAHFLKERSSRVEFGEITTFTPQEQRVFQLLVDFLGKTVPREDIAKVLWGDSWQHRYSEQAIDRLVSNIRSKLNSSDYTIVSAKGAGISVDKKSSRTGINLTESS